VLPRLRKLVRIGTPENVGLAAARDKLVFGVYEATGNIWRLPDLPRP